MFVELMPLLKQRTLLITVARIDEKLKVNVIRDVLGVATFGDRRAQMGGYRE